MDDLMGCFLWQELREIAAHHKENDTFPANWGKQPYNTKKNRYRDIVPCEWNHKCIMHIYVTTMHVYMCNDYHIYYDQFSGCPISSHGSWAYFLLININYNKANLKQKNQYCIYLINLGLLTQQHLRFFLYFQSLKMNISVFNPCNFANKEFLITTKKT